MAGMTSIIAKVSDFTHKAAEELCEQVLRNVLARTIVLDLHQAEEISTAAFARLVLLRRELLKTGRDLRLSGLCQRAANVWRINRLVSVLPVQ